MGHCNGNRAREVAGCAVRGVVVNVALAALAAVIVPIGSGIAGSDEFIRGGDGASAASLFPDRRPLCARPLSPPASGSMRFSGLYPAIEGKVPLSNFRPGQIVEIDPRTMSAAEARSYIKSLQALGALVSIYLVGGHCDRGADCESLTGSVRLASTGSWNWDKNERRILDIVHPAVLARLSQGIRNGWQLGANFIRIDNLHNPAGSSHPRTPAQMKKIVDLAHAIEDQLRADGGIATELVTGLVAHNNFVAWKSLIEQGELRRLPAFLTSERTAQLAALPGFEGDARMKAHQLVPQEHPEIHAARRIAQHFQIPYTIVEFRQSHDLARPGETYELPQTYVDALRRLRGVSEVIVMRSESHYVGRPEAFEGPGPNTLPRHAKTARALVQTECLIGPA